MGARRSRIRRPPTGLSRRAFLKRGLAASAALASLPLLPACGSSHSSARGLTAAGESPFKHGIASGDPLSDRIVFWTRVTPSAPGDVEVTLTIARDAAMTQVVSRSHATTSAARDYTVKIDQAGLLSATSYYYRFSALGHDSAVGRARTLPTGTLEHLRFAVVCCASYAHGLFNAYRRVADRADLDFVLHLGDYIYEYSSGADGKEVYGTARVYEPPHEILTLEDYRTRHAQYKRDFNLMEMHRQHSMIAIWDDHEFADNSWKDGATNHNESGSDEGAWSLRVANALQAYYEWMPVRVPADGDLLRNYRTFPIGDLVDLILLEERVGARDAQLPGNGAPIANTGFTTFSEIGGFADANRTLLGATEEAWLADQMRNSTARWRLLGQGVMLGQLKLTGLPNAADALPTGGSQYINNDQWDGYAPARQRLFDVLTGDASHAPVDNVVVLTGDIHTSWAMDVATDPNNVTVYNPLTGTGALAVEYVCTSVTSPGLEALAPVQDAIRLNNPHIQYVDLSQKGYLLMDVTPARVSGEWWYVDRIDAPSVTEAMGAVYQVADGVAHLVAGTQSTPRSNPPEPAP